MRPRRAKGPVSRPRADRPNKKVGLMGGHKARLRAASVTLFGLVQKAAI
jgi:hypothetical protein